LKGEGGSKAKGGVQVFLFRGAMENDDDVDMHAADANEVLMLSLLALFS